MSRLILEIWEYPQCKYVAVEELQEDDKKEIIQQAKDIIKFLEE